MIDDINQQILAELRKLRQFNQRSCYVALGFMVVFLTVYISVARHYATKASTDQTSSWKQIDAAWYQQDYPKALALAQEVVARESSYYYGHAYLGNIHLAMNNITNAEAAYLRAYELFPNKEQEENLAAIRKRLDLERSRAK